MDLDQLLDELNVNKSPPKKHKSVTKKKETADDWGDEPMGLEDNKVNKKGNSASHKVQPENNSDEWDTGDKKDDPVIESASSEESPPTQKEEEKKAQKPNN